MKLKELRIKNGFTQHDLAKKLNVSSQTILNWENEIYEPKISQLIQIADLFDVSLDYLLERNKKNIINEISNELYKVSKDDLIHFIKQYLEKLNNK